MRNTGTVTNNYDNLFAGEVAEPVSITVAKSQTVKRGDLLECVVTETIADGAITRVVAAEFGKPSAKADPKNIYVVAADAITTGSGATGIVAAYRAGNFNGASVALGGESTVDDNYETLLAKGIVLKAVQSK